MKVKNITGFVVIILLLNIINISGITDIFIFPAGADISSEHDIDNILWNANFDNETERTLSGNTTSTADKTINYYLTANDGATGEIVTSDEDENNRVVKFVHTKANIGYATWIQLVQNVTYGIKPTGTNKILITEARIYASSTMMDSIIYNYYWNGSSITKTIEQKIPLANRTSGKWSIYKVILDTQTGDFAVYFDGDKTAEGTIPSVALTEIQTYGMWPQIRAYANGTPNPSEYMLIDYIKVGEPAQTATPTPTATVTPTPDVSPSQTPPMETIIPVWNANFDNESEGVISNGAIRNNVNYIATVATCANSFVKDEDNQSNMLLKMQHTDINLQWQNWVQLPDYNFTENAGKNGVKLSFGNDIYIIEAKVKINNIKATPRLILLYYNQPDNRTNNILSYDIPENKRLVNIWMYLRIVLNAKTGNYSIYLNSEQLSSGTTNLTSEIKSYGIWPKLHTFSSSGAAALEPQYMLVDYLMAGQPNFPAVKYESFSIKKNNADISGLEAGEITLNALLENTYEADMPVLFTAALYNVNNGVMELIDCDTDEIIIPAGETASASAEISVESTENKILKIYLFNSYDTLNVFSKPKIYNSLGKIE